MKKFLTLCMMMVATLSIYAKDMREFIVTTTPKMSCENCENKIKGNLRFEKGVKKITTDLKNQLVTVTYDAEKTDENKLKEAFGKINYKVTKVADESTSSIALGVTSTPTKVCCKDKKDCKDNGNCSKDKKDCKDHGNCSKDKKDCKDHGNCSKDKKDCKDHGNCSKDKKDCKDHGSCSKDKKDCKDHGNCSKDKKDCKGNCPKDKKSK